MTGKNAAEPYDLELDSVIAQIKKQKARKVCIQLPDGLKPKASSIADSLRKDTWADIIIWAGSCYGACDVPKELEDAGVDLLVQWGHSAWKD